MKVEFECRKCRMVVFLEEYNKSRFCPNCGTFLKSKRLKNTVVGSQPPKPPIEIRPEDINLASLFFEYNNYSPIAPGGGIVFSSVDNWISARKRAYKMFREKFSGEKLLDFDYLSGVFKDWLLFRNNLSWTTLQRTGYSALEKPERLAELIILLRNDNLDVGERVRRGLVDKEKVRGIGQGILTGLLHTFFDDKYCVWNSRTQDTLKILRRPIGKYSDIGKSYKTVNRKILEMAQELETDLTTLDGFMWFISKHVQFI
ncbi:MAG: hypothetical protein NUK62_08205 [Tenericutes bacterium]|nr:hypothetical protein [Mycoplasmatota bacterium]